VSASIVCLGEGHADCDSLPTLLTRVAALLGHVPPILPEPIRFKRQRIERQGELARLLGLARKKLRAPGGILLVLDADDDCPAELGPRLLAAARSACSDVPLAVVAAKRMFETWVIAGAEGLFESGELARADMPSAPEEDVRSPKQWLSDHICREGGYGEVADLKRLTGAFSLEQASIRSPSFEKLCREVGRLLAGARGSPPE